MLSLLLYIYFQYYFYENIKISSIGASTILEISIASFNEGLYCAFSNRIIVSLRTPTFSANCSCVIFFNSRYFFNLHSNSAMIYFSMPLVTMLTAIISFKSILTAIYSFSISFFVIIFLPATLLTMFIYGVFIVVIPIQQLLIEEHNKRNRQCNYNIQHNKHVFQTYSHKMSSKFKKKKCSYY